MIKNSKITASNNDSLDAVISFVKKCRENKTDVHSFEIIFTVRGVDTDANVLFLRRI